MRHVAAHLHDRSFDSESEAAVAANEFIEFCRGRAWIFTDVGVKANGERLYSFTHRSFLEFLAASHLASISESPGALAQSLKPRIMDSNWEIVGELSIQVYDRLYESGAERVITALLDSEISDDSEREVKIFEFAKRCSAVIDLSPSIMQRLSQ